MNIIAYRLPNAEEAFIYKVDTPTVYTNQPEKDGFIISPFEKSSEILFYPYKKSLEQIPEEIFKNLSLPSQHSLAWKSWEYKGYVSEAISEIKKGTFEKVVTSSRKEMKITSFSSSLFEKLTQKYPDAFVFLISTEEFGTWIGASPELLLRYHSGRISSMALAGTRSATAEGTEWDIKNIREQKLVTDHIVEVFKSSGLDCTVGNPNTARAGQIEHIRTLIECDAPTTVNLERLLTHLSPTPALGGYPQLPALNFIKETEGIRSLYGGFAGPVSRNGDLDLFVLIRCAQLMEGEAILFAGGGITALSDPEEEYKEIKKKFGTLESIFFDK